MLKTTNDEIKSSETIELQNNHEIASVKNTNIETNVNSNNNNNKDHYNPAVRLIQISKASNDSSCGFNLSRSKWDPYPWVSAVDQNSPAGVTGLKVGDCVLEVNGEDILGLRISEIANIVKSKSDQLSLLLWSTGRDPSCEENSLCCGPMPLSLERLSASMQTILACLECPVCMDIIPAPVSQCQNGHILCIKCRAKSEKCPVCRQRYSCVRSLIAEQIYSSIIAAFKLHDDMNRSSGRKLREKLFGAKYKKKQTIFETNNIRNNNHTNTSSTTNSSNNNNNSKLNGLNGGNVSSFGVGNNNGIQTPTNKFLARILGKAHSLDNLNSPCVGGTNSISNNNISSSNSNRNGHHDSNKKNTRTRINSFNDEKNKEQDLSSLEIENMTKAKHFSLSTNDLSKQDNQIIAIPRCPSVNPSLMGGIGDGNVFSNGWCTSNYLTAVGGLTLTKRPSSLNASAEYVNFNGYQCLTLDVPEIKNMETFRKEIEVNKVFLCPCDCGDRFDGSTLENHMKFDHSIPIISFGSSSIEVSLPMKEPIHDAAMLLTLDNNKFWLKLRVDKSGSILVTALLQGTEDESSAFMLEGRLRNRVEDKLLEKELITRSIVYSMMKNSWNIKSDASILVDTSSVNEDVAIDCDVGAVNDDSEGIDDVIVGFKILNSINSNRSGYSNKNCIVDCSDEMLDRHFGIFYNQNSLRTTFNANSELLLEINIKQRQNISKG